MRSWGPHRENYAAKLGLITLFLGGFLTFASRPPIRRRHARALDLSAADLVLLTGATFRLGRMIAFDKIFEPARVFMTIMSTVGAAEVLNALTEHLSWTGRYARKETGTDS